MLTIEPSYNDALRHSERRRVFNVPEFKRLAALSVNQKAEDVVSFEKLAEGGFNRTFLVTMRDGFQFVGRIPYPVTEPKHLVVASEVATIDFLRSHNIPVPKIYSYSTTSENPTGTEYIFMELVPGTNLGDIWYDLPEKARIRMITNLVKLESRLFDLQFPASGSLYYAKDLKPEYDKVDISSGEAGADGRFCIGPDTSLHLWYGKRQDLQVDRGPRMYQPYHFFYLTLPSRSLPRRPHSPSAMITNQGLDKDPTAVLIAGAKKEIAYLTKFGRPLHPFSRMRREIYDYQRQEPRAHLESLDKYLRIVPHMVPTNNDASLPPTLRHPDLQPNNVMVSDDLEITGLIDWQHCAILPLFLQCGIPSSLQNWGDSVSESLTFPELPPDFDDMNDSEKYEQVLLLRKRQLHFYYFAMTAELNPTHNEALADGLNMLRRRLFTHASDPWEGDNVTLKADLIDFTKNWSKFVTTPESNGRSETSPVCPISFAEEEVEECLRLNKLQVEADEQMDAARDVIGVGREGWMPADQYDETKQRECSLKADALAGAESEEERAEVLEHWLFDDFDEEEYM